MSNTEPGVRPEDGGRVSARRGRAARAEAYPRVPEGVPEFEFRHGAYVTSFARSWRELDEVFRLRYEVFNRELGEGLALSEHTERDEDLFDRACHHLIVREADGGSVVGTYRLMTASLAARGPGFYSAREFELGALPAPFLEDGVELGRACIAKAHRARRVLFHLWRGIGAYVVHNRKRYLFGCASVPTQDLAALRALEHTLQKGNHLHPELRVEPCAAYRAPAGDECASGDAPPLPSLLRSYFSLGATVCGGPAIDREFGCADYFVFFDAASIDEATYRRYTES